MTQKIIIVLLCIICCQLSIHLSITISPFTWFLVEALREYKKKKNQQHRYIETQSLWTLITNKLCANACKKIDWKISLCCCLSIAFQLCSFFSSKLIQSGWTHISCLYKCNFLIVLLTDQSSNAPNSNMKVFMILYLESSNKQFFNIANLLNVYKKHSSPILALYMKYLKATLNSIII